MELVALPRLLRPWLPALVGVWLAQGAPATIGSGGALDGNRHRVLVTTDIGGTDADDFQSLVHLLLYGDVLDIEGVISSPYGPGRKSHVLEVIARYEDDYPRLRRHSRAYPTPDALRALTKQGETEVAPYAGVRRATEGSDWIVVRARQPDNRPLHVLVWGGLEDLAQALHDAPDIAPKLRVYFIGGPNKKWSPNAYQYIATTFPDLWIIEANSTYRGWFTGGSQSGELDNRAFVERNIAGHGTLGNYFARQLDGTIKMGDTPSVAYLLKGTPDSPESPSWGGRFVKAWPRPYAVYRRLTTAADHVEHFGILELALWPGVDAPSETAGRMIVENQELRGHLDEDGWLRFRFSPKDPIAYTFTIRSTAALLDGRTGGITAVPTDPMRSPNPAPQLAHWWTDDPSPAAAEGVHLGARTVSQWREAFLADFAARLDRLQ